MLDWHFLPAHESDFERLFSLRLRAMRESLERLGRFDPVRARARFLAVYDPAVFRLIALDGEVVGCVRLHPYDDHFEIGSFYLEPTVQGRGLGSAVLTALLSEVDAVGKPVRLTVLRESRAQALYLRFGFAKVSSSEWDEEFERPSP